MATDGSDGRRALLQTAPRRGFDTGGIRMRFERDGAGPDGIPPAASIRSYLRNGLPAIYHEGDFGLRFIAALETVLDPIVAILDSLHAHIDPDLAPRDMLEVLAFWLGVETDESWPDEQMREIVRNAAELSRRRGTRKGLELQLAITFPDLPLRVEETGGVVWAAETSKLPSAASSDASFVVYCDKPVSEAQAAGLARAIEYMKPVHVHYRLRVKAPKKAEQEAKKP
jgi:phage tail-like protein